MSFSSLFFLATCFGMYKLGAFNARHPGVLRAGLWRGSKQLWKWLNQ
jgi:hypothetical protein